MMAIKVLRADGSWKSLAEVETEYLRAVIDACGGCKVLAATVLRMHRRTLQRKLKRTARRRRVGRC